MSSHTLTSQSPARCTLHVRVMTLSLNPAQLTQVFSQLDHPCILGGHDTRLPGNEISYWAANPDYILQNFSVSFSNETEGLVMMMVNKLTGKWEIRGVAYALLAESPKAESRILKIGQSVMAGMQSYLESLRQ